MTRAGLNVFSKAYPFVNQKVRLWDSQFKSDFGANSTVHPVTRLNSLNNKAGNVTEREFQYEFSHIFSSMGDRHTFYSFPMPHSCVSSTIGLVYKNWGQYQFGVDGIAPINMDLMTPVNTASFNRTHLVSAIDGVPVTTAISQKRWELYGMQPATLTPFYTARLVHTDGMIARLPTKPTVALTFTDPTSNSQYTVNANWIFAGKRSCLRTYHDLTGIPYSAVLNKRSSNPTLPIAVSEWQKIPGFELPEPGTPLAFTQFRNSILKINTTTVTDPLRNVIPTNSTGNQRRDAFVDYTNVPGFEGIMGWKTDIDPTSGLTYSALKINAFVFVGRFYEMALTIRNLLLNELSATPYLVIDLSDNPGGFIGSGQALIQLIAGVEVIPHYNYMINEPSVINFVSNGKNTRIFSGDALMNQYENTSFVYDRNDWEKKRVEYNQFGRVWSQVSVIGGNAQTGSTAGMTAALALESGIPRLNLNGNSGDSASQFAWYRGLVATADGWESLPQTFANAPNLLQQEMYLSLTRMKGQSEFNEGELSGLPWEDKPNAELLNYLPLAIYRSPDKIARVAVNRAGASVSDYLTSVRAGTTAVYNLNITNRDNITGSTSTWAVSAPAPIPAVNGSLAHNSVATVNVAIPTNAQSTTTRLNFAVNGSNTVMLLDVVPAFTSFFPLAQGTPLVQGGSSNFSDPAWSRWVGMYRRFIADPIPTPTVDNKTLVFFNDRGDRGRTNLSYYVRTTASGRVSARFNYSTVAFSGPTFPVADRTTLSLYVIVNTTSAAILPLDKTIRTTGTVASYDSITNFPANTNIEFRILYDSNKRWDYGYFNLHSVNINLF